MGPVRRIFLLLPLIAFAGLVATVAVPLFSGRDPHVLPSALIDQPVPEFSLPPVVSDRPGLVTDDLRSGGPALVNVFASWCLPCRVEHPVLSRLAREEGVTIHAINYKDNKDEAISWLTRLGNPYQRIGGDTDGQVSIDWGVYGVPETFLIDRSGRIRYRHVGPISPEDARSRLLPLLHALEAGKAG